MQNNHAFFNLRVLRDTLDKHKDSIHNTKQCETYEGKSNDRLKELNDGVGR